MLLYAVSQLPGFINVTDRLKRLIASVSQSKQAQILNTFMPTFYYRAHIPMREPGLAAILGHTLKSYSLWHVCQWLSGWIMCSHGRIQAIGRRTGRTARREKTVWEASVIFWVRVFVKWSHRPWRVLTLNFSGYVCVLRPLTLAPGTCLRSLLSASGASVGFRTLRARAHAHTLSFESVRLLLRLFQTKTNRLWPDIENDKLCVTHSVDLHPSNPTPLINVHTCVRTFEYTHKVVSEAHL